MSYIDDKTRYINSALYGAGELKKTQKPLSHRASLLQRRHKFTPAFAKVYDSLLGGGVE